ncbi:hypothetical protein [Neobacillus cucumis]|uniref:Uncharacterized protein n=1 Tax=Neobacillus cucumis TaxID=1740721 RepID=A0A2N5HA98_9BACI|nr:hypothetical protein [Neobacillus cucumis]PLS02439.1 hypothetical protein CVD27_20000 [Neobacillus cucumis]
MTISIISSITLLILISYCVTPKKLHIFEIIFIWLVVWLLMHPLSWIIYVNLTWLKVSTNLGDFWAYAFDRLILLPLLIVLFFEALLRTNRKVAIYTVLFVEILILMLDEYVLLKLGVLHEVNWNIVFSFIEKSFILLISYFLWMHFRKKFM